MSSALVDRVAIVTGASRGIGAAAARRLAAEGARVALVARTVAPGLNRLAGSLTETAAAIVAGGGTAAIVAADLSAPEFDAAAIVARVAAQLGPPDLLVNNAGLAFAGTLRAARDQDWERSWRVNVRAPLALALAAAEAMTGHRGAVVNLTSFAAEVPGALGWEPSGPIGFGSVYGACKAALNRWTVGLAAEIDPGIVVNALAPQASVRTDGALLSGGVRPERTEPIETVVEALVALASPLTAPGSGRIWYSLDLLAELRRPVHTLDGRALVAGWQPDEIPVAQLRRDPL